MYVVATAGHVDHGKSTLVRALTGMEPDRWAEERRRGMTIDLGYAWMTLPSADEELAGKGGPTGKGGPAGEQLAFVDVPGHERFVPNMLAGLGPVPAVMFVVAADGGWMPQSAEHLAAVDALGVRHGLLVVTRADLADPGPATRQALAEISKTSLGRVEAISVSAVTGQGLDELRAALSRLLAELRGPARGSASQSGSGVDPVRLWIDRSFTIRGAGTVVTGTLPAGTVRNGQELLLSPSLQSVRVRGLQALELALLVTADEDREHLVRNDRRRREFVTGQKWRADIDNDEHIDVHRTRHINGKIFGEAAIHQQAPIALDRGKHARRGQACPHRACQIPVVHHDRIAGFQIGRHGAKRRRQGVEVCDFGDRYSQPPQDLAQFLALNEPFGQEEVSAPESEWKFYEKILVFLLPSEGEVGARRSIAKGILPVDRSHDLLDVARRETARV